MGGRLLDLLRPAVLITVAGMLVGVPGRALSQRLHGDRFSASLGAPVVGRLGSIPYGAEADALATALLGPPIGIGRAAARLDAETKDHRREGLIAGAVALGLTAAVMGWEFCTDPPGKRSHLTCLAEDVPFTAMGALAGGGVGSLIGGLFPKD